MKTTKVIYLIILTLILSSCKKDKGPEFIDKVSDNINRYQVTLINNEIHAYKKFVNDTLSSTTEFQYSDSIVIMTREYSSTKFTSKSIFTLGDNQLAVSSRDSSVGGSGLRVADVAYQYQNGFLTEASYNYWFYGELPDSGSYSVTNTIEGENIVQSTEYPPGWSSGCKDYFSFNDRINKIDLINLNPQFNGKINKNLITHATWRSGCPCGSSSSTAKSDFHYEINQDGWVTKMTEIYTPCYHLNFSEVVTRLHKINYYEYDFR